MATLQNMLATLKRGDDPRFEHREGLVDNCTEPYWFYNHTEKSTYFSTEGEGRGSSRILKKDRVY